MSAGIVISLFDRTGKMVDDYLLAGYDCFIVDGQHESGVTLARSYEGQGALYKVGLWFDPDRPGDALRDINSALGRSVWHGTKWGVKYVFGFPECTYLTVTGARWLYHPEDKHLPVEARRPHPLYPNRKKDREDAIKLFKLPQFVGDFYGCPWFAENPAKSMLNTRYRRPDHVFDPFEYGGYLPEDDVHPDYPDVYPGRDAYDKETGIWCGNGFIMPDKLPVPSIGFNPGWAKKGGKSLDTKNVRSVTPRGFARAVYQFNK